MVTNNFFLVPQIVADEKYFDVSIPEIVRALNSPNGKFERAEEHITTDEFAIPQPVILRLNVNCQSKMPEGWTMALKLHNERIDGFDWESEFTAKDGSVQQGWHRHEWNQRTQSAKKTKIPLSDLDTVDSREQFLIRAFGHMRIRWSTTDYGDQMPITEIHSA